MSISSAEDPELFRLLGRIESELRETRQDLKEYKAKVDTLQAQLTTLNRAAERWRGGFIVVLAFGSLLGMLITLFGPIIINRIWHGG